MFAQLMTSTAHLSASTTAAEAGSGFIGSFVLALAAVGLGIFVAIRFLAMVTAVIEGLVKTALTVGTSVLVIAFLAGIVGVGWISSSFGG